VGSGDKKGELKKGEMAATDEGVVGGHLRRQGFKSITVKKKPKDLADYLKFGKGRVKEKEIVVFARIFSTMINAGLPLIQCLDLLAQQEKNKTFAKVITAVKEEIEGGATLNEALKKHPKIFDDLFVNLVAAGESGGNLDVILSRLSNYMEKAMNEKQGQGRDDLPRQRARHLHRSRGPSTPEGYSGVPEDV
jgi:type IV pilus assembly protein PilC